MAVATTPRARGLGLAGLGDLPPWMGLELRGCRSVHTLGMRFALDLVWVDADRRVVRVDAGVLPWRARTCLRARSVIETRAGSGPALAAALGGVSP